MRIDRKAGVAAREALLLGVEAQLLADGVHQIGAVAAVDHGELRIELQVARIVAQQPVGHRMEGAGPGQALRQDLIEPPRGSFMACLTMSRARRRISWAARRAEGQHQDPGRVDAIHRQVRDAMRQGIGLAGAGAGDDQQGPGIDALVAGLSRRPCR